MRIYKTLVLLAVVCGTTFVYCGSSGKAPASEQDAEKTIQLFTRKMLDALFFNGSIDDLVGYLSDKFITLNGGDEIISSADVAESLKRTRAAINTMSADPKIQAIVPIMKKIQFSVFFSRLNDHQEVILKMTPEQKFLIDQDTIYARVEPKDLTPEERELLVDFRIGPFLMRNINGKTKIIGVSRMGF